MLVIGYVHQYYIDLMTSTHQRILPFKNISVCKWYIFLIQKYVVFCNIYLVLDATAGSPVAPCRYRGWVDVGWDLAGCGNYQWPDKNHTTDSRKQDGPALKPPFEHPPYSMHGVIYWPNWENFSIISIFGAFLVKITEFDPPG